MGQLVSTPARTAGDPGSNPGLGENFSQMKKIGNLLFHSQIYSFYLPCVDATRWSRGLKCATLNSYYRLQRWSDPRRGRNFLPISGIDVNPASWEMWLIIDL